MWLYPLTLLVVLAPAPTPIPTRLSQTPLPYASVWIWCISCKSTRYGKKWPNLLSTSFSVQLMSHKTSLISFNALVTLLIESVASEDMAGGGLTHTLAIENVSFVSVNKCLNTIWMHLIDSLFKWENTNYVPRLFGVSCLSVFPSISVTTPLRILLLFLQIAQVWAPMSPFFCPWHKCLCKAVLRLSIQHSLCPLCFKFPKKNFSHHTR